MKNKILFGLLIILPVISYEQEKLNKLQTPTSPASSILGLQPAAVLSPKSYEALETALFSNFIGENGSISIPNDFALEFTPYWTKSHGLSLDEYLYPKSGFDQFVRNSSISVASTQNFLLGDSSASNSLAFGYRTTFYFGNNKDREVVKKFTADILANTSISSAIAAKATYLVMNENIKDGEELISKLKPDILKAIYQSAKFDNLEDAVKLTDEIIEKCALMPPLELSSPDTFIDSLNSIIDNKLDAATIYNQFKSYIGKRYGFSVDVAYAGFLNFPSNSFEAAYLPRQSFWITPTYNFKDRWSALKLIAVLRYEWYNSGYYKLYFPDAKIYQNNFDYGLSVAGEFKRFSLSFEIVGRYSNSEIPAGTDSEGNELYRKDQKSDFQYIGSFSYNLTQQIIVSYSIGNRFEPIQNPENTLVSVLSINLGFGAPTKEDLK
jgi:hypothetical protein